MEHNDNGITGGDAEQGVGSDLPGSPSAGAESTLAADGGGADGLDPDTGLPADGGLDPDPVDDANPETDGVG